jgi:hypothetical protein
VEPDSLTQISLSKLRRDLEQQGYWNCDTLLRPRYWAFGGGSRKGLSHNYASLPAVPSSLLGLSKTKTDVGWLDRDYIHSVDSFTDRFGNFVAFKAGLYSTLWSDKYNKRHAFIVSNELGEEPSVWYQWFSGSEFRRPIKIHAMDQTPSFFPFIFPYGERPNEDCNLLLTQ